MHFFKNALVFYVRNNWFLLLLIALLAMWNQWVWVMILGFIALDFFLVSLLFVGFRLKADEVRKANRLHP